MIKPRSGDLHKRRGLRVRADEAMQVAARLDASQTQPDCLVCANECLRYGHEETRLTVSYGCPANVV
ncbi:hypothetical protein K0M31_009734 [Melipona bicolor]|uniref:Uncharacterized protein n=1 Tax=Melipona bicolor TaxID=60889 RepID=A0AA40FMK3_9HYME|nr:hypothetical protein K0M31_009734 [Melipona bicolor]